MARPVKKFPKRNVISFRLNDPELAALRYLAEQVARPGETFNATIARYLKNAIKQGAEQRYADWRAACDTFGETNVSVSLDRPDDRRKAYRRYVAELRAQTGEVFKAAEREAPERATFEKSASPEKSTSPGSFAFPSVVVSLAPGAAHTPNTESGEPTAKTENLARPAGGAVGDSAGKLEQFPEERGNSPFLPRGGLENLG